MLLSTNGLRLKMEYISIMEKYSPRNGSSFLLVEQRHYLFFIFAYFSVISIIISIRFHFSFYKNYRIHYESSMQNQYLVKWKFNGTEYKITLFIYEKIHLFQIFCSYRDTNAQSIIVHLFLPLGVYFFKDENLLTT